ncbi:MAG TPA: response regulator [Gemmataceae bacterium]|nr:response regulator [Gemmataceae bacterium]
MSRARIVVIDEDTAHAGTLQQGLTRLGYAVVGIASAADALALAQRLQPDLVLLTLPLPAPADAVALAEQFRTGPGVPVVYLATHADTATLQRAQTSDPFGYVFEPAEEPRLAAVLEVALGRRRQGRLEGQSRQTEKMDAVGQLAGGIAHDFNNLLTVVNGYSGLLLASMTPDHPWHGFVAEIYKAGERAAELTRQLLAFSRKQMLQPRVLDVNQIVAGMEAVLRRVLGEGITLATQLESELPLVKTDPGQLEQVLMSLADNAHDAMPSGGTLTISTARVVLSEADAGAHPGIGAGAYACMRVADTGVGMDEATRARVFEPFFTTKPVGKGSGLGLASVYGIVTQSGGHIEVASTPGQGTCFTIYLPPAGEEPAESGLSLPGLPRGAETVLLVEDEEGVRRLNRQVLRLCGYTVLEAGHAVEALKISGQYVGPIELLVTDVVMPEMNGRHLAEVLAGQRPGLKVLFLSGYGNPDPPGQDHSAFLAKPYSPAELAKKVRAILDG